MTEEKTELLNPYKPGAGHMPPFLAGREGEAGKFERLLEQQIIIKNCLLIGLRGVGKTVLIDELKKAAIKAEWLWTGNEISESSTVSEERLCFRIMADLSMVTSVLSVKKVKSGKIGFVPNETETDIFLTFQNIETLFQDAPGLESDKLKYVLEYAWQLIKKNMPHAKGLVFAYDEAQSLSDYAKQKKYALTMLLDVFQSIQKKGIPFMLLLCGLPVLQTKLVESRTYTERMFTVLSLNKLSIEDSRLAIVKPLEKEKFPIPFDKKSVEIIIKTSAGYPYFIQFICKETFDAFLQQKTSGKKLRVPIDSILLKLDDEFYAGRWGTLTDRQRELLLVIAQLENREEEFTLQQIVTEAKKHPIAPFSGSQVNQMLTALSASGMVFKNRFGKYSFAIPQLHKFIQRQNIGFASTPAVLR
jgi:GTPase SAR1 family protein